MDITQGNLKMLYESSKHLVWVVNIEGKVDGDYTCVSQTAFVVGTEGLLMTCAHGDWQKWDDVTIKCRPLGVGEFKHEARSLRTSFESDMCLLQVLGIRFCYVVKFGNGNLAPGEKVMLIGHPSEIPGFGVAGCVVYPCSEKAVWELGSLERCETYVSESLCRTPPYAIMGNVWNVSSFDKQEDPSISLSFEKKLSAHVPIVACSGLVGGLGSSGGPLFNLKGEVVGMLVMRHAGYDIAIHVNAIKLFVQDDSDSDVDENALEENAEKDKVVGGFEKSVGKKNKDGYGSGSGSGSGVGKFGGSGSGSGSVNKTRGNDGGGSSSRKKNRGGSGSGRGGRKG